MRGWGSFEGAQGLNALMGLRGSGAESCKASNPGGYKGHALGFGVWGVGAQPWPVTRIVSRKMESKCKS